MQAVPPKHPGARRFRSIFGALALTGALLAGGASGVSAAPAEPAAVDSHSVSAENGRAAMKYWTPERMKNAKNGDELVRGKSKEAKPDHAGKPKGSPDKNSGKPQRTKGKPGKNTAQTPISHVGKVFFTLGGQDYVCSGNSVVSANEATVSTAGHCANEGPGAFATRWVFAPAYENGAAPYGTFAATELVAPTQWSQDGDISYDTAFAVVSDQSGQSLTDQVGSSGVAFNQARGLDYTAFGYPAASPFNGETLHSCFGTASDDPYGQTQSQGISCDMTGGSSGGPWFIGSSSSGYQNSVNSFGYSGVRNTMFGPYWGSVIQSAYQSAQN